MTRIKYALVTSLFALLFCLNLWLYGFASAESFKVPPRDRSEGYIIDHAKLLSPSAETQLEAIARDLDEKTHAQMVLFTTPTIGETPVEDASLSLARTWGIGSKENTGLLIFMATEDKKLRTEVGYGLEGDIPDGYTGRIADEILIPAFKQKQYDAGFIAAFQTYSDRILSKRGLATSGKTKALEEPEMFLPDWVFLLIIFIFVILIIIGSRSRRKFEGNGPIPATLNALFFVLSIIGSGRSSSGGGGSSDGGSDFGGGSFGGGGSSRDGW